MLKVSLLAVAAAFATAVWAQVSGQAQVRYVHPEKFTDASRYPGGGGRDAYPPRIDLTFRLTAADGSLLKEGERKLREPVFALTGSAYRDDPLRYEKALLDTWLERELKL